MKTRVLAVALLFVLTLAGGLLSQTPAPTQQTPKNDDIVKITTTLIQIDATVLDKRGSLVRDLTPDDFEIYQNGELQKITNFSFIETHPNAAGRPNNEQKKTANSTPDPPLPVKLRPDQVARTLALVVDDLALSASSIANVKGSLKKFVDQQMQFGDLVAIIRTGGGAGFLQRFTSDKRVLYAAIDRIRWNSRGNGNISAFQPRDPSDLGATGAAIPDIDLIGPDGVSLGQSPEAKAMAADSDLAAKGYRQEQEDMRADIFAVGTLGAVNYVVEGMAKLPGRKAIVLFSEGFKLYTQDRYDRDNHIKGPSPRLTTALQNLCDSANRRGVIIYPVDTRGVVNPMLLDAQDNFDDLDRSGGFSAMQTAGIERSTELMETQQGLRALAEGTGGVAFVNNNNLNAGIERALDDQNGYYLIGFQPDQDTFDPKKLRFNKLVVKLKNTDLKVRYRSGFYGIKDGPENEGAPKTERGQIFGALGSPLDGGEFNLQIASVFANDAKEGNFIRTMIWVDGGSLTFSDDGKGGQVARYSVVALLFGEKNTVIDEVSRKQTIRASAGTLNEIKEKGFVATILVPIKKPGAYQMRVVLRDDASEKVGSASEFIQVPNLKKDQLYISGLLLQRSDDEISVNTPAALKQFQSDEDRDLAVRTFHPGTRMRLGFGIYNASVDDAAKSVNLSTQYRIYRDGLLVYTSQPKKLEVLDQSDRRRVVGEEEIKLGSRAKPGSYILQLIILDNLAKGKGATTYQFTDFEVTP